MRMGLMLRRYLTIGMLALFAGILHAQEVPESDDVRIEAPIIAAIHAQQARDAAARHSFNDRENLTLFSADLLTRTLDWQSTRMLLTNPCKCFHETQLPEAIVSSSPRMLSYSLAVAGVVHGAAYLAHKTGHHKLERVIPMLDILGDGEAVINNYAISGRRP
jgi:hypothetical protein